MHIVKGKYIERGEVDRGDDRHYSMVLFSGMCSICGRNCDRVNHAHKEEWHNSRGVVAHLVGGISGRVQAQLLGSLEPVLHFQTESFDIYAPPNMEPEAERLAGFADKTYVDALRVFRSEASARRIPVLLSDIEYSLNGYTTLYPSNRIVLLLASADPRSQLATMQDELYSVFFA
jgi:hypothetical protein